MSSVWLNADWDRNDELFNEANARFISACQRIPEIIFDGGLSMSSKEHCSPSLRNFACEGSFSVKEYLEKTGKSFVVFNASFSNHAHGWKLGEFLALGKALLPPASQRPARTACAWRKHSPGGKQRTVYPGSYSQNKK